MVIRSDGKEKNNISAIWMIGTIQKSDMKDFTEYINNYSKILSLDQWEQEYQRVSKLPHFLQEILT